MWARRAFSIKRIIGLDIGGTKCAVLLTQVASRIHIVERIHFLTRTELGYQQAIDRLFDAVRELMHKYGLHAVDVEAINKPCAPLYSENVGRPAIEPEVLFRMLFVGYLYRIRSERRLEEEINYNFAYKWFCGLGLTEKVPDATTISINRTRRFRDNNIAENFFRRSFVRQ